MINSEPFWYAGQFQAQGPINLSPCDPGFLYGATVFSTLRVDHQDFLGPDTPWPLHRDRLTHSVVDFGWSLPDWDRVEMGLITMAKYFPVLRVTLFEDGRELITGRPLPPDLSVKQKNGITAIALDPKQYRRSLPHHKTGNYLSSLQGRKYAQSFQCEEGIFTNPQGHWLETTTGNLWGWNGVNFSTPALTGQLLPGIKRQQLINQWQGTYPIRQESWSRELITTFTAIAHINSVVELLPITKVINHLGQQIWGTTGPFPQLP